MWQSSPVDLLTPPGGHIAGGRRRGEGEEGEERRGRRGGGGEEGKERRGTRGGEGEEGDNICVC